MGRSTDYCIFQWAPTEAGRSLVHYTGRQGKLGIRPRHSNREIVWHGRQDILYEQIPI